jgi:hypothetical protein
MNNSISRQMLGRLRQPGTCIVFTTVDGLETIIKSNKNEFAVEIARLILCKRGPRELQDSITDIMDGVNGSTPSGITVARTGSPTFRFDVFRQFCHSLVSKISQMNVEASCLFCSIMGNKATGHVNSNCPWSKNTCNKCFTPGHNRSHCHAEACKIPAGFCVMCLMPVHAVYGIHSCRYGRECSGELRDCMKPLVTLLFYSSEYLLPLKEASSILWSSTRPKPETFEEYWCWLWKEDNDRVYGILQVLNVVIRCASQ